MGENDSRVANSSDLGAILTEANFSGAILTGADVSGATFTEANFADAVLATAFMPGADLTGANLKHGVPVRLVEGDRTPRARAPLRLLNFVGPLTLDGCGACRLPDQFRRSGW